MLLSVLPQKYQALLAALPAIFWLSFKVSAAIGSSGSVIEFIGMQRAWPSWIAVGKKMEAIGTDFPKLLNDKVRPLLIKFGVKGLTLLCVLLIACGGAPPPKPCPVALQARYVAALVEACRGAGSVEACGDAGAAVTARHEAEQEDAGCRVK